GELGVSGAPAAYDVNPLQWLRGDPVTDLGRKIRAGELVLGFDQNARDVNSDIADANDHCGAQCVRWRQDEVGMHVVPADKLSGSSYSGEIFTGDSKPAIARGSGGEHHSVVHREKFLDRDIAPHLNVAEVFR